MHRRNHTVGKCALLDPVFIVPDTDNTIERLAQSQKPPKGTLKGSCSLCSTQE